MDYAGHMLCYDDFELGRLKACKSSQPPPFNSQAASLELVEIEVPLPLQQYLTLTTTHHKHLADHDIEAALQLECSIADITGHLGAHLWYLKHPDSGTELRIPCPYFASRELIYFYPHAPRVRLGKAKLTYAFQSRMHFMLASLSSAVEDMPKPRLQAHLKTLTELQIRVMRLPDDPGELYEHAEAWFGCLAELDSEVPSFEYRKARRQTLQGCALEDGE